jgi:hypothetical protein
MPGEDWTSMDKPGGWCRVLGMVEKRAGGGKGRPPSTRLGKRELGEGILAALNADDLTAARRLTRELLADLERGEEVVGAAISREHARPPLELVPADAAVLTVKGTGATPVGGARQAVTAALGEIGVAASVRLVADYATARLGERIPSRAFSTLRRDERRAWESASSRRPAYIVPALEGRFFQAVRGMLTRSDWPLERRLIGPWSERADHLLATAHLARQLAWLSDRDPDIAQRLAPVVAGLARSIPGALDGEQLDTEKVVVASTAEYDVISTRDAPWRIEAAERASGQLSEEQRLWGVRVGVVSAAEKT